jgi:hypothetical protein
MTTLSGKDKEEQAEAINKNRWLALMMYYNYSVNSELNTMLPNELFNTIRKSQQNISSTETVLGNMVTFIQHSIEYPFQDEEDRQYNRGIYKGNDKMKIDFQRVFPVARQWNKIEYIQEYMNWYKQYAMKL